jgi:hypothetical protein
MSKMAELHPLHHSMRTHVIRRRPRDMDSCALSHDDHRALTAIALEIFTDCINVGLPMQDALLAVYTSGLQHGSEATK